MNWLIKLSSPATQVIFMLVATSMSTAISAQSTPPSGPTLTELQLDHRTPNDVVTYGMGLNVQRWSPLDQINRDTVANLVPAWTVALETDRGQEGQPLVYQGRMYVTTHEATYAIDLRSGRMIWRNKLRYNKKMLRMVCCGFVNRGAVIFAGKLFRQSLDNRVIAIDLATGETAWEQTASDWQDGYTMTGTPLIANGVLITGTAGGDMGTRGFLDGWSPQTGEKLWRFWTTAAPGEEGGDSWEGDTYLRGGGATWLAGSYDAELNLVFWGLGNPGPWNANMRPGDNLFTDTIVALRPETGEKVWHYQVIPNDTYDYDSVNELIHATLPIDGEQREVIIQANRNGYIYVLDRATGELLRASQYVDTLNWADGIDMETGRPIRSATTIENLTGVEKTIWPSNIGGKNWAPASFSPKTRLVYLNGLEISMQFKPVVMAWRKGVAYAAAEFSFPEPDPDNPMGYLRAVDPLTGARVWQTPMDPPANGGTMVTAGDLVFTGLQTGELAAFDIDTGTKLWQYQTGSGIIAPPITYELDGEQYVAVQSGIGGLLAWFLPNPKFAQVTKGASVTVFKLFKPWSDKQ